MTVVPTITLHAQVPAALGHPPACTCNPDPVGRRHNTTPYISGWLHTTTCPITVERIRTETHRAGGDT